MPACAVSRSDRLWEQILSRSSKFKSMKAKTFCPFAQMRMSNHLSNVLLAQWHWACVCVFPNFNEGLRLRPGGSELDLVAPTQSGTIHLELVSLRDAIYLDPPSCVTKWRAQWNAQRIARNESVPCHTLGQKMVLLHFK